MLKKKQIRETIIQVLSDKNTNYGAGCDDVGLTDAKLNILDTHLDPLDVLGSENELPCIAVYCVDERSVPKDRSAPSCFISTFNVVLEIYHGGENGYALENNLDNLEEQVKYKLIPDKRFVQLGKLTGLDTSSVRDGDGRIVGMRRVSLAIEATQKILVDICDLNFKHTIRASYE